MQVIAIYVLKDSIFFADFFFAQEIVVMVFRFLCMKMLLFYPKLKKYPFISIFLKHISQQKSQNKCTLQPALSPKAIKPLQHFAMSEP